MNEQYKIIGGDGREYGPVSLEELKAWIRDGRVAGSTHVWRSDAGSWAPASSYPELYGDVSSIPSPTIPSAAELHPAGFWARLAAFIVDSIVLSIVTYAVWSVISGMLGWERPAPPEIQPGAVPDPTAILEQFLNYFQASMPYFIGQIVSGLTIHLIYDVSLNGRFGATLGKMVIGARIVRVDNSPIGYGTAFLRFLACRLSDMVCYIGYLLIAFRSDKRGMHDLIVGTKVVYKR